MFTAQYRNDMIVNFSLEYNLSDDMETVLDRDISIPELSNAFLKMLN